jgi:2-desacetyl-2-hydroxyethyl bacteriochlorophyllide A dehydrogenase
LVTAIPQEVCGVCAPCRRGDYNICDQLKVRGFQAPGVAQDFFVTESEKVVPLPDLFSFEQGAFVEPVSVAVHSSQKAGDVKNKNIVVLGAGPIGNLIAQTVKANGANVLITDISDYRLEVAKKCGLMNTSNSKKEKLKDASKRIFGENGFNIALECVGIEETMKEVIENIEKGGSIVVVGVFGEKPRIDLGLVQDRELKLVGTLMYKYEDYVQAVKLIADGSVVTEPLFSNHFKFEQYNEAYGFIEKQGEKSMKVFIDL